MKIEIRKTTEEQDLKDSILYLEESIMKCYKEKRKYSKKALYHNFGIIVSQMGLMGLLNEDCAELILDEKDYLIGEFIDIKRNCKKIYESTKDERYGKAYNELNEESPYQMGTEELKDYIGRYNQYHWRYN